MKDFCCKSFKFFSSLESNMGLNIRIIRLSEAYRSEKKNDLGYRVFITEGYENFNSNTKRIMINNCPFCGTDLKDKVNSDEIINEQVHPFQ